PYARHCVATAAPRIFTLSLHDALPIWVRQAEQSPDVVRGPAGLPQQPQGHRLIALGQAQPVGVGDQIVVVVPRRAQAEQRLQQTDRKSTRLNSSHVKISYAVFCLKKKN